MSTLVFRNLEQEDLKNLLAWHQDAELANRYGGSDWPQKLWRIMQSDKNRQCRIACLNNEPIGYVDIELHPDDHLMWIGLAVKPELRKQGFGKRILEEFLTIPFTQNFKEIWAGIEYDNIASRKCFENVGFEAKNIEPDEENILDYVLTR